MRMLNDMLEVCYRSTAPVSVRNLCVSYATRYFSGLALGGGTAFYPRQAQVCSCGLIGSTSPSGAPTERAAVRPPPSGNPRPTLT